MIEVDEQAGVTVLRMADGKAYDVVNPTLAVPMETVMFLAMPTRDRWKLLSYFNMTSIDVGAGRRRRRGPPAGCT